jgi:hypothetical protein
MNRDWILFHLKEAQEELERTIREIENDPEYEFGEYSVGMAHLYHHINTAWNAQNCTDEDAAESSESNFANWRQFPTDIDMSC